MNLSKPARELLRRRANGEDVEVTPQNLDAYRELAEAGVMSAVSTFAAGPESIFRFTVEGWSRRYELQRPELSGTSLAEGGTPIIPRGSSRLSSPLAASPRRARSPDRRRGAFMDNEYHE
jgi:hypothetical protein